MSMSRPIQPGDIFVSVNPRDRGMRIIVINTPSPWGDPRVATINAEGRQVRERYVLRSNFHDAMISRNGDPRTTGYVLEKKMVVEL